MPQIFQVLRCYKCLIFQVHQAKKSNKFQCKLCGEKQSIKRHYGIGTAKDCRMHVQKLNGIRGEIDELKEADTRNADTGDDCDETELHDINVQYRKPKKSKWSDYVHATEETSETTVKESMYLNDTELVLEVPKKRHKSFKCPSRKLMPHDNSNVNHANPFNIQVMSYMIDNHPRHEDNEIDELSKRTIQKTQKSNAINFTTIKVVNTTKQKLENKKECAFPSNMNEESNETPDAGKTVCPKICNNSKWAQFMEDEDCRENSDEYEIIKIDEPNTTNIRDKKYVGNSEELFALCDDSDLDNVLNI